MIKKIFLLFWLMLLLPMSASASFKGLHPPMEIEPELLAPPIEGVVFIKGGCYEMGDTFGDGYGNEVPVHTVCVDDFYIGKYEVIQKEWVAVMGNNPSGFKGCETCPVDSVSWDDAQGFIIKLNSKTGKNYRLPTEAEWEYAARSGGKKEKFSGFSDESQLYLYGNFCGNNSNSNCEFERKAFEILESQVHLYANCGNNSNCEFARKAFVETSNSYAEFVLKNKNTSPVGSYRPNGLGLYDMTGNVMEWVSDFHSRDYYRVSPKDNPKGPDNEEPERGLLIGGGRVLRGGSWYNEPMQVRASFRFPSFHLGGGSSFDGFRLALSAASTNDFTANCEKAGTLVKEANGFITKDPAKAESLYSDAIKLCPDSASAHYNLGLARFNKGDFSSAVVSFKEALRLNPQSVEAMNGLALSYASQGINYDESKVLIENALKIRPDDSILKDSVSFIEASRKPPYIIADLVIEDSDGNNILDAGEDVVFRFSVENKGKGAAINLVAKSDAPEFLKELKAVSIGRVMPGEKIEKVVNLRIPYSVKTGEYKLDVTVVEESGRYGAAPMEYTISVKSPVPPKFVVNAQIDDDMAGDSSGNGNGVIEKGETIEIHLSVSNEGSGTAKNVIARIKPAVEGIGLIVPEVRLGNILPQKSIDGTLAFSVPLTFKGDRLPLEIVIEEETGLFTAKNIQNFAVAEQAVRRLR